MLLFDDSDEAPIIRRTTTVPADPQAPSPSGEQRPAALTCIESQPMLEKLRAGAYEQYAPPNFFLQVLADDVAEEFWMKRRLSDITNQSLSLEIEASYDKVSQSYPNVDRYMRTVLAWRQLHDDPAFHAALAERTRAGRSFQAASRNLASLKRKR